MKAKENMKALYIIVNAGFADEVVDMVRKVGVKGATIINARGKSQVQESFMGINMDPEKEMIICIVDEKTAETAMAKLMDEAGKNSPANSVSFSLPVDKMVGGRWFEK